MRLTTVLSLWVKEKKIITCPWDSDVIYSCNKNKTG